jgi:hypothetical protein
LDFNELQFDRPDEGIAVAARVSVNLTPGPSAPFSGLLSGAASALPNAR